MVPGCKDIGQLTGARSAACALPTRYVYLVRLSADGSLPHLLPLARQVRHHPEKPLDEHQLRSVVHLVLLDREQQFESALAGGTGLRRQVNVRGQEVLRQSLEPTGPRFPLLAERLEDLRLVRNRCSSCFRFSVNAPQSNPSNVVRRFTVCSS